MEPNKWFPDTVLVRNEQNAHSSHVYWIIMLPFYTRCSANIIVEVSGLFNNTNVWHPDERPESILSLFYPLIFQVKQTLWLKHEISIKSSISVLSVQL